MNQRMYNRITLPKEFKFKVNQKHLSPTDHDYTYICKNKDKYTYTVSWSSNQVKCSRNYHVNEVLDYIIDLEWIMK